MSENKNSELKEQIRQTELVITGVAEVLESKDKLNLPPSSDAMPIPSPAERVNTSNTESASTPAAGALEEESAAGRSTESAIDELQEAWLASLDQKANELNTCIAAIQESLRDLSKNVQHLEAEAKMKDAEAEGMITDTELRKRMADRTYIFMVFWCLFIGSLMLGYMIACDGKPPKEFMLGILGTCTISIIGLVGFVVNGLFKVPPAKEQK